MPCRFYFVGRPLHVSQRETCERYRHRQWDGFCRADFILSSDRFTFLKAKRASVIDIGNGIGFAEQILFCRPPASSFSKRNVRALSASAGRIGLAEQFLFCCPPASRFSTRNVRALSASAMGWILPCRFYFVARPLQVSKDETCDRYRHRQWDGFCRTDFILSSARFKFLKAKRASVIDIGERDGFCRVGFILSSARFTFFNAKRASGTQEDDGLYLTD